MNKYQKQALLDFGKVTLAVIAGSLAVAAVTYMGVSAGDLVGTLSLIAMGY